MFKLLFFLILPATAWGWADLGHEIVAEIAKSQMTQAARDRAEGLASVLAQFYPRADGLVAASIWADDVKGGIRAFDSWHYIDLPYAVGEVKKLPEVEKENLVWALCQSTHTLVQTKRGRPKAADNFEKAFMLRFLIHLVADAHQPLHAISRVTAKHKNGDKGGNLFRIRVNRRPMNLHLYWDLGLGLFEGKKSKERAGQMAAEITKEFPKTYFGDQVQNANYRHWADSSHELAKTVAYQLTEESAPSDAYIKKGRELVRKQLALAGYRLAFLLNTFFTPSAKAKNDLKTGCRL